MRDNRATIDLSALPPPDVVQIPVYEDYLANAKSVFLDYYPEGKQTLELESEPVTKLLEVIAYLLMLKQSDINDAARAVMLAFARGHDLDQLGALYNVKRLVIQPADPNARPPVDEILEDDERFRIRIKAAPLGFSIAGPVGAYIFHAMSASGEVLDASAISTQPGDVVVTILSRNGQGTASAELLNIVNSALSADDVRPLTDNVRVQSAEIMSYNISATLNILPGPDSSTVLKQANENIRQYVDAQHKIGTEVALSGIYAALHVAGVESVTLKSPSQNLQISDTQASYCTEINLNVHIVGDKRG